jgi:hypothetical protein
MNFVKSISDEATHYDKAATEVIEHIEAEISAAKSYSLMLQQHKRVMPSPRLGQLANMHSSTLTPAITKLTNDIEKVEKMKKEMLAKISSLLEEGIGDLYSQRYVDLSPNTKQVNQPASFNEVV